MNILIYESATGNIHRAVSCSPEMVEIQCLEGEDWIEHDEVDDSLYQIDLSTMTVVPK